MRGGAGEGVLSCWWTGGSVLCPGFAAATISGLRGNPTGMQHESWRERRYRQDLLSEGVRQPSSKALRHRPPVKLGIRANKYDHTNFCSE